MIRFLSWLQFLSLDLSEQPLSGIRIWEYLCTYTCKHYLWKVHKPGKLSVAEGSNFVGAAFGTNELQSGLSITVALVIGGILL